MISDDLARNIDYIENIDKENIDKENKLTLSICEEFLDRLPSLTGKHSVLENRDFLDFMGSPDEGMKIIHVAGTNGKGSVCNYVSSILKHAGYKAGMFTSPHLVRITERFQIDGREISEDVFIKAFLEILNKVKDYQEQRPLSSDFFPSYFEYLFFMAMVIYKVHPVDYLVLETGLGGLLDVTNVIRKPLVSIITEVGKDHMQYLGDTYEEIAAHKAGIIKKGIPVIFFDKRKETTKVITDEAIKKQAKIRCISDASIKNVSSATGNEGNKYVDFCYDSEYYNYVGLCLRSSAVYQTQNAALAISCIEELKSLGADISLNDIQKGLLDAKWPCRMEEIKKGFIVDGAHNADGIEAFLKSAGELDSKGSKILLFGVVSDKQYMQMASMIGNSRIFDKIAVCSLKTGRSLDMDSLKDAFSSFDNVSFYDSVDEAACYINSIKKDDDLVFAAGSLYLAGQLKEKFE